MRPSHFAPRARRELRCATVWVTDDSPAAEKTLLQAAVWAGTSQAIQAYDTLLIGVREDARPDTGRLNLPISAHSAMTHCNLGEEN